MQSWGLKNLQKKFNYWEGKKIGKKENSDAELAQYLH